MTLATQAIAIGTYGYITNAGVGIITEPLAVSIAADSELGIAVETDSVITIIVEDS